MGDSVTYVGVPSAARKPVIVLKVQVRIKVPVDQVKLFVILRCTRSRVDMETTEEAVIMVFMSATGRQTSLVTGILTTPSHSASIPGPGR